MSQPVKIVSRSSKARSNFSPDNPIIHRNNLLNNLNQSQNQTLPRNPKLQLANLTPYEIPQSFKVAKPRSRSKLRPGLNSSFSVTKLTRQKSSDSITDTASLESIDIKGDLTPSTQPSIDKARDAFSLERKLNEKMKTLGQRSPMSSDKFRIFRDV